MFHAVATHWNQSNIVCSVRLETGTVTFSNAWKKSASSIPNLGTPGKAIPTHGAARGAGSKAVRRERECGMVITLIKLKSASVAAPAYTTSNASAYAQGRCCGSLIFT